MNTKIELAKGITIADYIILEQYIKKKEIADMFFQRLTERYIKPFSYPNAKYRKDYKNGFAMMANASLLIETYMSFKLGINDTNGRSKEMFKEFFKTEPDFAIFNANTNSVTTYAEKFYRDVRCGILHQGETKSGWTITRKKNYPLFDKSTLKINAYKFSIKLKKVLNNYRKKLINSDWNDEIWRNFRRKMHYIISNCQTKSIVVLGWGSLIWDRRNLHALPNWNGAGPSLPIEFARISKDGRLTLVIREKSKKKVEVLWSLMNYNDLEEARKNLQKREGTPKIENIGFVDLTNDTSHSKNQTIIPIIKKWAKQNNFDAVIWTDLAENFLKKTDKEYSLKNIISYLNNLTPEKYKKAKEYIEKTPKEIQTEFRSEIEKNLK